MKSILLFLISFVVGAGLLAGYLLYKTEAPIDATPVQNQNLGPTFSIEPPPSETLKGKITDNAGILFWESRIATEPAELKELVEIKQGERLITKEGSKATVNFDRFGSITLSEDSDLAFIQTLPVNFTVQQRKGKIKYEINGTVPASIRIRSALITKESGSIEIAVTEDDSVILISTLEGVAKIGFNDKDYVSQVFDLREGQVYEYDSDERTAINQANK